MSRLFYHVMQDNLGNLLFDVSGTMRLAGTGTLATIYGDEARTIILPNPMTNHLSYASFKCFLGPGDYDFYMAKSGYSFETLTGVQGYGTLAQQDASAVTITGNVATVYAPLVVKWLRASHAGLILQPIDADTGTYPEAMKFLNLASTPVGFITTNATTTAYLTTSDARLKEAIKPLGGALDVLRALNPVSFVWKADGSPGRGLLAQEVQDVIPDGVITGAQDAVDTAGQIVPQMINYSALVPYLVGAVKELTQQVEMLQAQLAAAGV